MVDRMNSPAADSSSPPTLNSRQPYRSESRPLKGPTTAMHRALGTMMSPTCPGEYPFTACR